MRHHQIDDDEVRFELSELRNCLTRVGGALQVPISGTAEDGLDQVDVGGVVVDDQDSALGDRQVVHRLKRLVRNGRRSDTYMLSPKWRGCREWFEGESDCRT